MRLLYSVFFGGLLIRNYKKYKRLLNGLQFGDANSLMTDGPLFFLGLGSIFAGSLLKFFFVDYHIFHGFSTSFLMFNKVHSIAWFIKDLPFFLSVMSIIFFFFFNEKFFFFNFF